MVTLAAAAGRGPGLLADRQLRGSGRRRPEINPYVGGALALILALMSALSVSPWLTLWVLIFHVIVAVLAAAQHPPPPDDAPSDGDPSAMPSP